MKRAVIISSLLIVIAGLFANYLRYNTRMPDAPPTFSSIPYTLANFAGEEQRFADYNYDILKADTTTLRQYTGPTGEPYWLFVAYFSSQRYGSQIHSPKHCLPGGGWRIDRLEPYEMPLAVGGSKTINRLIISDNTNKELMFYWFETRGGAIRNEFGLKWDLMVNSLMFRPTDAAIIRLTTPLLPGEDIKTATDRAMSYLKSYYPSIEQSLPFSS